MREVNSHQNKEVQSFIPLGAIPNVGWVSEPAHCYVYFERIVGERYATNGVHGLIFVYFLLFPFRCLVMYSTAVNTGRAFIEDTKI